LIDQLIRLIGVCFDWLENGSGLIDMIPSDYQTSDVLVCFKE